MVHDRPPIHLDSEEGQSLADTEARNQEQMYSRMREHLENEGFGDRSIEVFKRVMKLLSAIYHDEFLAERLGLHGGIPIGMVFSEDPQRLSYDIDPVYRHVEGNKDWGEVRNEIDEHIKKILYEQGYAPEDIRIRPTYKLNRFVIRFNTDSGQRARFLIEIGYMNRAPLANEKDEWHSVRIPGTDHEIRVRTPTAEEVFADKFMALLMRESARDLYDIWSFTKLRSEIDMDLFRKCVVLISLGDVEHPLYQENPLPILNRRVADDGLASRLSRKQFIWVKNNEDLVLRKAYDFVREILDSITDTEREAMDMFYFPDSVEVATNKDEAIQSARRAIRRIVDTIDPDGLLSECAREHPPIVDLWVEMHTSFGRGGEKRGRRRE